MDIKRIERRIFLSDLNSEMLEKRITQKELGKYLGIRQSQLSLWLNGNTGMSLDMLIRISNAVKNWETRDSKTLNEPSSDYGDPELSLGSLFKKHLPLSESPLASAKSCKLTRRFLLMQAVGFEPFYNLPTKDQGRIPIYQSPSWLE